MLIPTIPLFADPNCLICLLILMLMILMMIMIKRSSMLSMYWLGDRKLVNAYLTKHSTQNNKIQNNFLKIENDVL